MHHRHLWCLLLVGGWTLLAAAPRATAATCSPFGEPVDKPGTQFPAVQIQGVSNTDGDPSLLISGATAQLIQLYQTGARFVVVRITPPPRPGEPEADCWVAEYNVPLNVVTDSKTGQLVFDEFGPVGTNGAFDADLLQQTTDPIGDYRVYVAASVKGRPQSPQKGAFFEGIDGPFSPGFAVKVTKPATLFTKAPSVSGVALAPYALLLGVPRASVEGDSLVVSAVIPQGRSSITKEIFNLPTARIPSTGIMYLTTTELQFSQDTQLIMSTRSPGLSARFGPAQRVGQLPPLPAGPSPSQISVTNADQDRAVVVRFDPRQFPSGADSLFLKFHLLKFQLRLGDRTNQDLDVGVFRQSLEQNGTPVPATLVLPLTVVPSTGSVDIAFGKRTPTDQVELASAFTRLPGAPLAFVKASSVTGQAMLNPDATGLVKVDDRTLQIPAHLVDGMRGERLLVIGILPDGVEKELANFTKQDLKRLGAPLIHVDPYTIGQFRGFRLDVGGAPGSDAAPQPGQEVSLTSQYGAQPMIQSFDARPEGDVRFRIRPSADAKLDLQNARDAYQVTVQRVDGQPWLISGKPQDQLAFTVTRDQVRQQQADNDGSFVIRIDPAAFAGTFSDVRVVVARASRIGRADAVVRGFPPHGPQSKLISSFSASDTVAVNRLTPFTQLPQPQPGWNGPTPGLLSKTMTVSFAAGSVPANGRARVVGIISGRREPVELANFSAEDVNAFLTFDISTALSVSGPAVQGIRLDTGGDADQEPLAGQTTYAPQTSFGQVPSIASMALSVTDSGHTLLTVTPTEGASLANPGNPDDGIVVSIVRQDEQPLPGTLTDVFTGRQYTNVDPHTGQPLKQLDLGFLSKNLEPNGTLALFIPPELLTGADYRISASHGVRVGDPATVRVARISSYSPPLTLRLAAPGAAALKADAANTVGESPVATPEAERQVAAAVEQFVGRNGTRFVLGGQTYYPAFANHAALWRQSRPAIDEVLSDAKSLGLTAMRLFAFCEGASTPETCLQPTQGSFNETAFEQLDYIVYRSGQLGLRLIIPLVDQWDDGFGGMRQYVNWLKPRFVDDIPEDLRGAELETARVNDLQSGTPAYAAYQRYHDLFYTNTHTRAWYQASVAHLLNRVNRYTNIAYKDDPTIFMWELANEPRCESDPSGATLLAWIQEMARFIKLQDPNHLVSTGEEGWYRQPTESAVDTHTSLGADFVSQHQVPEIDACSFHLFPKDNGMDEAQAKRSIEVHVADCHRLVGKPAYLGEFGWPVKRGDVRQETVLASFTADPEGWQAYNPSGTPAGASRVATPSADQDGALRYDADVISQEAGFRTAFPTTGPQDFSRFDWIAGQVFVSDSLKNTLAAQVFATSGPEYAWTSGPLALSLEPTTWREVALPVSSLADAHQVDSLGLRVFTGPDPYHGTFYVDRVVGIQGALRSASQQMDDRNRAYGDWAQILLSSAADGAGVWYLGSAPGVDSDITHYAVFSPEDGETVRILQAFAAGFAASSGKPWPLLESCEPGLSGKPSSDYSDAVGLTSDSQYVKEGRHSCRLDYGAPAQGKAYWEFSPLEENWTQRSFLRFAVYSPQGGLDLSVAVSTGAQWVWHESRSYRLHAGWNTLQIDLQSADWKTAATNWELGTRIADLNAVHRLSIGLFGYPAAGSVWLDNLQLDGPPRITSVRQERERIAWSGIDAAGRLPRSLEFSYRIDDGPWSPWKRRTFVPIKELLDRLGPGRYSFVFQVRARGYRHVTSDPKSLAVNVEATASTTP